MLSLGEGPACWCCLLTGKIYGAHNDLVWMVMSRSSPRPAQRARWASRGMSTPTGFLLRALVLACTCWTRRDDGGVAARGRGYGVMASIYTDGESLVSDSLEVTTMLDVLFEVGRACIADAVYANHPRAPHRNRASLAQPPAATFRRFPHATARCCRTDSKAGFFTTTRTVVWTRARCL